MEKGTFGELTESLKQAEAHARGEIKHIPFCVKCSDKVTEPIIGDKIGGQSLVGCKKLDVDEWKEGWKDDEDGTFYQHNCPLFGDKDTVWGR